MTTETKLSPEDALMILTVPLYNHLERPVRVLDIYRLLRKGFEHDVFPESIRKALGDLNRNASGIFLLVYPPGPRSGLCGQGYMDPAKAGFRPTAKGCDAAHALRRGAGISYEETVEWVLRAMSSSP